MAPVHRPTILHHQFSLSRTPAGIRPSLKSFSKRATSAKLFALWINAFILSFSLGVSWVRLIFDAGLAPGICPLVREERI